MERLSSLEMTFSIDREILPVWEDPAGVGLVSAKSGPSEIFGSSTIWRGSLVFVTSFAPAERLAWKGSSEGRVAEIFSVFG